MFKFENQELDRRINWYFPKDISNIIYQYAYISLYTKIFNKQKRVYIIYKDLTNALGCFDYLDIYDYSEFYDYILNNLHKSYFSGLCQKLDCHKNIEKYNYAELLNLLCDNTGFTKIFIVEEDDPLFKFLGDIIVNDPKSSFSTECCDFD